MNYNFVIRYLLYSFLCVMSMSCQSHAFQNHKVINWQELLNDKQLNQYDYAIEKSLPHDKNAFTEGLFVNGETLYESAGLYLRSRLRILDVNTGSVIKELPLSALYFAEGIAVMKQKIYQLTYHENHFLIYDEQTKQLINIMPYPYPMEGWGLTCNESLLIMSNGSNTLFFIDPTSFKLHHILSVTYKGAAVNLLNSLAYINGKIYANIWGMDIIVIISIHTGQVEGIINLAKLFPEHIRLSREAVLNGIAYDNKSHLLIVTGKWWPNLYKIQLIKK